MDKKGMIWGRILKLVLMVLVVGAVIVFLGKGTHGIVKFLADMGIIEQSQITESAEEESEKTAEAEEITEKDKEYFSRFVDDIKKGIGECSDSVPSDDKGICRCSINIRNWDANPPSTVSASNGYLFRLQSIEGSRGSVKGIEALGMKDTDDDFSAFSTKSEKRIGEETVDEDNIVCTTSTFEDFDTGKDNFGLDYEPFPMGKANFFRRASGGGNLEIGIPGDWVDNTNFDSYYTALPYGGISVIRFDKNYICFPTDRDSNEYGFGTSGGSISGYLGKLREIPECLDKCLLMECTGLSPAECDDNPCCKLEGGNCVNDCSRITDDECQKLDTNKCGMSGCCEIGKTVHADDKCRKKGETKEKDAETAFDRFVEDMKKGFTSAVDKVPPKGKDICRVEMSIRSWQPTIDGDKGYLYRLYKENQQMKASGFEGVEIDYDTYEKEHVINDALIFRDKSPYIPCVVSTMDDFDEEKPKFNGLEPEKVPEKLNFFRSVEEDYGALKIGMPGEWIGLTTIDSTHSVLVIGGKIQLIKFYEGKDKQDLCFVTNKEDSGWGLTTEGDVRNYLDYINLIKRIPLCEVDGE